MASQNQHNDALKVLAETASDDELLHRYDDAKHASRSSSGDVDPSGHVFTSSGAKGDDGSSGSKKTAESAKKDGLRKGKWIVSNPSDDVCK